MILNRPAVNVKHYKSVA